MAKANTPDRRFEGVKYRSDAGLDFALQLDAEDRRSAPASLERARGAADLVAVDVSLTSQMGATASGRYVRNLDRALRSLDR